MNQHSYLLTDFDLHLHLQGSHWRTYEKLGAQIVSSGKTPAVSFAVWAPNAQCISVIGDFNGWDRGANPLHSRGDAGVWELTVSGVQKGACYKFYIENRDTGEGFEKADPYAFYAEQPPKTASRVWSLDSHQWKDDSWMKARAEQGLLSSAMSIYEVHLGSWRRTLEEEFLTYRDLAEQLPEYMDEMGFTHLQLLPITEHPFDASWGYQPTSYFAPTSRFGPPEDFMLLVDRLHEKGIGVILDWVPAHFPEDGHGLAKFDGTGLFEHVDPREGFHPDWNTLIFNYGRTEVTNFLISSALFWCEQYHIDGLRLDAVASMLYRDYSRSEGEWIPNCYGGRENLEAINFLKTLNEAVYSQFPGVTTIAEESTSWPMVSRPTYAGGLGFGFKWNMGWMNDVLHYMSREPVHRCHHQNELTFSMLYAFHENFILPLSHDEVVHGKGSLVQRMPGDLWQKFANLRLLFGYMFGHPGKKLLFMGGEFAQFDEWCHGRSLDWHLLDFPFHQGVQNWVRDLNTTLRSTPALHQNDVDWSGFEWVDCSDHQQSVLSFLRFSDHWEDMMLVVCNFTPVVRHDYAIGVPRGGWWREVLNSDAECYGGSNVGNCGGRDAEHYSTHGREYTLKLSLPPLSTVFLRPES